MLRPQIRAVCIVSYMQAVFWNSLRSLSTQTPDKLLSDISGAVTLDLTSCARGDTICLHPLQVDNIFAFIRQVAPVLKKLLKKTSESGTIFTRPRKTAACIFGCWCIPVQHVGYLRHQQQVDLWPFDLQSSVRVTCDVGYLCANFSLPRPLFSS